MHPVRNARLSPSPASEHAPRSGSRPDACSAWLLTTSSATCLAPPRAPGGLARLWQTRGIIMSVVASRGDTVEPRLDLTAGRKLRMVGTIRKNMADPVCADPLGHGAMDAAGAGAHRGRGRRGRGEGTSTIVFGIVACKNTFTHAEAQPPNTAALTAVDGHSQERAAQQFSRLHGCAPKTMKFMDATRAHFHSPVREAIYVDLPPEEAREEFCAKLIKSMCGTRQAASKWLKQEQELKAIVSGSRKGLQLQIC